MSKLTGAELIAQERQRQIDIEGWTPEHDAEHNKGEMVQAAICYAREESKRRYQPQFSREPHLQGWPWNDDWWKPCPNNRIHELAKAGALIAAEIDRLKDIEP